MQNQWTKKWKRKNSAPVPSSVGPIVAAESRKKVNFKKITKIGNSNYQKIGNIDKLNVNKKNDLKTKKAITKKKKKDEKKKGKKKR